MKASLKIDGAGRGGKEHCNLMTHKLAATDHRHVITFDISDPQAGCAEEVAVQCRR